MKKIVEDKLSMYKRALLILAQNQTLYSVLLALVNSVNLFTTKVAALDTAITLHLQSLRGITGTKKEAKAKLANAMLRIAGALLAYSALNNDLDLEARVTVTPSKLKQMRDSSLPDLADFFHTKANSLLTALTNYGINAPVLVDFQATIASYRAILQAPSAARSTRKTLTAKINTVVKDCDNVLKKQIDKLMLSIKETQPFFYSQYTNSRRIVKSGNHKHISDLPLCRMHVVATNGLTSAPIKDVVITLIETAASARSDAHGKVNIEKLVAGTYSLHAYLNGFAEFIKNNIVVESGKEYEIAVALQPVSVVVNHQDAAA